MLNSNTSTTAVQPTDVTWCIWEIKINVPKQVVYTCLFLSHSVVNQQSQHQVPLCLQCHDGSYLSLSQHSSTYTARQTTMLQASISRSPVSANIRHAPLFLHTIEPQVFNYSRLISQMWQLNPRSLTKQTRPSRFSCQKFSFQLPSPGMTPGSVAPRTVHSVRPGSTTTWPTCRDVTLSYSTFLVWTYAAPCHPAHFLSTSFQCFLVILQALSLSAKITKLPSDSPSSRCQSHHNNLSLSSQSH